MTTGLSIGLNGNWQEAARELDQIGRQVFPAAMAGLLTKAAWDVRDAMRTYISSGVIDKPRDFTKKAFTVKPANWRDGDNMKAEINVLPKQAEYFWFLIMGGDRHPQDSGKGAANDFLTWSRRPTGFGGAYAKNFVKKTSHDNREERLARRTARSERHAFATANANTIGPHRDMRWIGRQGYKPGTFFGTVQGIEGYWQRPARLTKEQRWAMYGKKVNTFNTRVAAAQRRMDRVGNLNGIKQATRDAYEQSQQGITPRLANMPWTKPGQQAKLLLAFRSTVPYDARFDYDGVMTSAFNNRVNDAALASSLRYHKGIFQTNAGRYTP
ncbi:hypothetical protein ELI15_14045 [Rhizobium ruizarguesonis]|uniref:hypothetical protein n=1 Tax=Rhizobium ruizarguesonis TaxID=2081791 RepID=UPI00102FCBC7|nr:hypothetical protein [Rhizobium ruizarguesonis]TAW65411.1 hypothetical protein ELI15_14045 [Rhizobium ruizarguesonis]